MLARGNLEFEAVLIERRAAGRGVVVDDFAVEKHPHTVVAADPERHATGLGRRDAAAKEVDVVLATRKRVHAAIDELGLRRPREIGLRERRIARGIRACRKRRVPIRELDRPGEFPRRP